MRRIRELHADYYDLRKVNTIGKGLAVTLPTKECKIYGIAKGTTMRLIAKYGRFLFVPEEIYQNDENLKDKIEEFFTDEVF